MTQMYTDVISALLVEVAETHPLHCISKFVIVIKLKFGGIRDNVSNF